MSNTKLIAVLKSFDDPLNRAVPAGFDDERARKRFYSILAKLNAALETDLRFECGEQDEDATFHSQIFISDTDDDICFIRFSNFGDFASIYYENEIRLAMLPLLETLLADHSYNYLPFVDVAIEYTGHNSGQIGIDTWWTRYFGWISRASAG